MYCKKCGNAIEENVEFCGHCGSRVTYKAPMPPQQPQYVQQFGEQNAPKKKRSKMKVILIVVLIACLLGGVGYGVVAYVLPALGIQVFGSSNDIVRALERQEYNEALSIYALDYMGDTSKEEEAASALLARLEAIKEKFIAGKMEYAVIEEELGTIGQMHLSGVSDALTSTKEFVSALNDSRVAYETAQALLKEGSYKAAVANYNKVIQSDDNYSAAQEELAKAVNAYREQALGEAKEYAAQQEYASAIDVLNAALSVIENDTELTKLLTVYERTYIDDVITEVNTFVAQKNYSSALSALEEAEQRVQESSELSEKLDTVRNQIPAALSDVVVIDSQGYQYYDDLFTDSFGNTYGAAHEFSANNRYAVFNLDQSYATFSAKLVASEKTGSDARMAVAIYADDQLVYSVSAYDKQTGAVDINLNVTGVTKLTIKTSKSQGNANTCLLYLVNATLSR